MKLRTQFNYEYGKYVKYVYCNYFNFLLLQDIIDQQASSLITNTDTQQMMRYLKKWNNNIWKYLFMYSDNNKWYIYWLSSVGKWKIGGCLVLCMSISYLNRFKTINIVNLDRYGLSFWISKTEEIRTIYCMYVDTKKFREPTYHI